MLLPSPPPPKVKGRVWERGENTEEGSKNDTWPTFTLKFSKFLKVIDASLPHTALREKDTCSPGSARSTTVSASEQGNRYTAELAGCWTGRVFPGSVGAGRGGNYASALCNCCPGRIWAHNLTNNQASDVKSALKQKFYGCYFPLQPL